MKAIKKRFMFAALILLALAFIPSSPWTTSSVAQSRPAQPAQRRPASHAHIDDHRGDRQYRKVRSSAARDYQDAAA